MNNLNYKIYILQFFLEVQCKSEKQQSLKNVKNDCYSKVKVDISGNSNTYNKVRSIKVLFIVLDNKKGLIR